MSTSALSLGVDAAASYTGAVSTDLTSTFTNSQQAASTNQTNNTVNITTK